MAFGVMMAIPISISEIEITSQFGSEVRTEIKKKYEIISCHSARHTYAILSLENGMRPEIPTTQPWAF